MRVDGGRVVERDRFGFLGSGCGEESVAGVTLLGAHEQSSGLVVCQLVTRALMASCALSSAYMDVPPTWAQGQSNMKPPRYATLVARLHRGVVV